jgi:hypothetical protein
VAQSLSAEGLTETHRGSDFTQKKFVQSHSVAQFRCNTFLFLEKSAEVLIPGRQ